MGFLGSVLAQMAFPLPRYVTNLRWEEKNMFQSQPNRHISSRSQKFCTGGAKMWRFSERMWQKTSQVRKKIRVWERHILPRNVTNVTHHIFCHRKKWQMWRHSPKSETGACEEIWLRPTLMPRKNMLTGASLEKIVWRTRNKILVKREGRGQTGQTGE